MRRSITIRRWQADLYQRAIHIQKQPNPKCGDCKGSGGIEHGPGSGPDGEEPDIEPCHCWNPYRALRIPLGPRPVEELPF